MNTAKSKRARRPAAAHRTERIAQAWQEASVLYNALLPLNMEPAEEYLEAHPPSAAAIAFLPALAVKLSRKAAGRHAATAPRPNTLRAQLRSASVVRYTELRDKAPELLKIYTKRQLTEAISKLKGKKKLP